MFWTPAAGPLLQLTHQAITEEVIGQQGQDEGQLGVHPALLKPGGIGDQESNGHGHRHDHSRRRDDVGEPLLHQAVLGLEGILEGRLELFGFPVIDEQPHQIKQASEPNHHPDDVQGLEPEVGLRGKSRQGDHRPKPNWATS